LDRIEFCAKLLALTCCYSLVLSLIGGSLVDGAKQIRWGALCPALGLLVFYPLSVIGTIWLRPTWFLGSTVSVLVIRWCQLWSSERTGVGARLQAAGRQALWLTGLAVFFWAPGAVGHNIGLFTEAGGDFTIYAGLPEKVGDAPLWHQGDLKQLLTEFEAGHLWVPTSNPSPSADPPAAGWSVQRIVDLKWGTKFTGWFALQQALSPIKISGIEERYMSLLAMLWALLVAVVHKVIWLRSHWSSSVVALLLCVSSHHLAGVGYNHYFPQLLCSAILISLLALLTLPQTLTLSPWVLLLLAGLTAASAGLAYYPMLPALLVPLLFALSYHLSSSRAQSTLGSARSVKARIGLGAMIVTVLVLLALPCAAQLGAAMGLLHTVTDPTPERRAGVLLALGPPRPYDVTQLASFWGAFSLRRLPPYHTRDPSKNAVTWIIAVAGALALSLTVAYVVVCMAKRAGRSTAWKADDSFLFYRAFTIALLPYLAVQLYLGRPYEYTQYKAIAYTLPFVLLYLSLPLPAIKECRWATRLSTGLKILLVMGLLYFRAEPAFAGYERAAILDVGLHRLTKTLQSRDSTAFVLAYPFTPWLFSLWELGLRDQKGLIMKYYVYPRPKASYIQAQDVQHLWIMAAMPPTPPVPDILQDRSLFAYRPLSSPNCNIQPTALQEDRPSLVPFTLLNHPHELLWRQTDNEFWVFNAASQPVLTLAFESEAGEAGGSELEVELAYPIRKKMLLAVNARNGDDKLIRIPREFWQDVVPGGNPELVVLRIPGRGYSGLFCGNESPGS